MIDSIGGGGGSRTHGPVARPAVFKPILGHPPGPSPAPPGTRRRTGTSSLWCLPAPEGAPRSLRQWPKSGPRPRLTIGADLRLEGLNAASALSRLYAASRMFVNFFQPSFKLASKTRLGAKVRKTYHAPETPFGTAAR